MMPGRSGRTSGSAPAAGPRSWERASFGNRWSSRVTGNHEERGATDRERSGAEEVLYRSKRVRIRPHHEDQADALLLEPGHHRRALALKQGCAELESAHG